MGSDLILGIWLQFVVMGDWTMALKLIDMKSFNWLWVMEISFKVGIVCTGVQLNAKQVNIQLHVP
jgi:hypothetical protein